MDVINETIVKTLDTPLNLVKTSSNTISSNSPKQLVLLSKPPIKQQNLGINHQPATPIGQPATPIGQLASPRPISMRQSVESVGSSDSIIKVEPQTHEPMEIVSSKQNTEIFCKQSADSFVSKQNNAESFCKQTADSSTPICIANANGASLCRGEVLNLNKLTCYLDLITRKVVKDDGASAMERAIIKSRLKIPFWSADEVILIHFLIVHTVQTRLQFDVGRSLKINL